MSAKRIFWEKAKTVDQCNRLGRDAEIVQITCGDVIYELDYKIGNPDYELDRVQRVDLCLRDISRMQVRLAKLARDLIRLRAASIASR